MKKVITLIVVIFALNISAQSNYEKGMNKAFELWSANKSTEAGQLFERISKAEKENWLPPFYAATIQILESFQIKEEAVLKAKLNKAQEFLDLATANSPNNPEILITQALLNVGYIAFDGQKYGMSMSIKNTALYAKALKIAPNNPRVILSKAENDIGTARFFGQSTAPFCKDVKKAIALSKKEKITTKFYPTFLLKRAEEVLSKCEAK
ncbi:tetratricopeptide repeat protein [Tenacibaculum insulae]|uniref:tetratricopeptide repeat protein n=1 Tax=Tenacibaculum insulae TaxID=2029677 RepID=UPI003AB20CAD